MDVEWAADDQTELGTQLRAASVRGTARAAHLQHDIRAAASTIVWLTSALELHARDEEVRERATTGIVECAQLIVALTNGDTGEQSVVDNEVSELVQASAERARLSFPVTISTNGENGSALVTAPRIDLVRVVDNLLTNACRAAGRGGHVEISITARRDDVVVDIVDSGPGIEETRVAGGLGLDIVAALVAQLGGEVSVSNIGAGRGTRARLVFPRRNA